MPNAEVVCESFFRGKTRYLYGGGYPYKYSLKICFGTRHVRLCYAYQKCKKVMLYLQHMYYDITTKKWKTTFRRGGRQWVLTFGRP